MWYFTVSEPHQEPKVVNLKPGKHIIGCSWDNDINIEDDSASRQHAQAFVDPAINIVTIIDLKSTNGIYVNGELIEGVFPLASKDSLLIGNTRISLTYSRKEKVAIKEDAFRAHISMPKSIRRSVDQYPVRLY